MLLIRCPHCEAERPEVEFRHGGEALLERPGDPTQVSDTEWIDYLYMRRNLRGPHAERWRHLHGCGRFFNCLRDTVTDRIIVTWPAGEPMPDAADGDGA